MATTTDLKLYQIGTPELYPTLNFPMCGGITVYGNTIACTDTNGRAINPAQPSGGKCWGVYARQTSTAANTNPFGSATALANCALTVDVLQGIFAFPFCTSDSVTEATIGSTVYVYDNATVTITNNSTTTAGKCVAIAGIGQGVGLPNGYMAVAFGLEGNAV